MRFYFDIFGSGSNDNTYTRVEMPNVAKKYLVPEQDGNLQVCLPFGLKFERDIDSNLHCYKLYIFYNETKIRIIYFLTKNDLLNYICSGGLDSDENIMLVKKYTLNKKVFYECKRLDSEDEEELKTREEIEEVINFISKIGLGTDARIEYLKIRPVLRQDDPYSEEWKEKCKNYWIRITEGCFPPDVLDKLLKGWN